MKKIPKSIDINISPVILYIEELEKIEEIYKDNFESYEIIVKSKELENDFEFTSIEELTEFFDKKGVVKLNELSFEASNPYIHVEFDNVKARIYGSGNDVKSVGIINKLKNIANKRPAIYEILTNNFLFVVSILILLLVDKLLFETNPIIVIILFLLYVVWGLWSYNLLTKNYSVIYLKKGNLQKSFLAENKDKIILILIGAFISVIAHIIKSNIV